MGNLVTVILKYEVTEESDGLLLEAFGKREDGSSGGCFTSAIEKVKAAASKYGGKTVESNEPVERNTFHQKILFPNKEAIHCFEEDLIRG